MVDQNLDPNMRYIVDELRRLNTTVEKISDRQGEMNVVLTENTVIVKEHERRSLAIEGWAEKFESRVVEVMQNFSVIEKDVEMVKSDIKPIKKHVERVNKIVNFLDGVPVVLKVTVLVFTIITSMYGVFVFVQSVMPRK